MSGTFPSSDKFKDTTLSSIQPSLKVTGDSGRTLARDMGGHLWTAKANMVVQTQAEFAPVQGFMAGQRGDSFLVEIPPHNNAQGTIAGTALINGTYSEGDTSIKFDGITGTVKAGDFINVAGHTKAYMIEDDVTAGDGTLLMETGDKLLLETGDELLLELDGQVTVTVYPALIEDVANNEAVTYDGVQFTMALKGDIVQDSYSAPNLTTYSFDLIEAL